MIEKIVVFLFDFLLNNFICFLNAIATVIVVIKHFKSYSLEVVSR